VTKKLRGSCDDPCKASLPGRSKWLPIDIDANGTIAQTTNTYYSTPETFPDNATFDENNCMFGDGVKTSIISINDQFPGPTIEVKKGAKVHVTVKNHLKRFFVFSGFVG